MGILIVSAVCLLSLFAAALDFKLVDVFFISDLFVGAGVGSFLDTFDAGVIGFFMVVVDELFLPLLFVIRSLADDEESLDSSSDVSLSDSLSDSELLDEIKLAGLIFVGTFRTVGVAVLGGIFFAEDDATFLESADGRDSSFFPGCKKNIAFYLEFFTSNHLLVV